MDNVLTALFVAALLAMVGLRLWLARRHVRHVVACRDAVPHTFADRISLESHRKAADYTVARTRLGVAEMLVGSAVLVGWTLLGGVGAVRDAVDSRIASPLVAGIALILAVMFASSLLDLPIEWFRQFRLEARFGFNRMTPALWVADLLKSALLSLALGVPLLAVVLWLMTRAGNLWWFYGWCVWSAFSLSLIAIYPNFIAPLFNKFTPLADGDLAGRIEALAQRTGFALRGLFVMDGSRRSAHGNAYFTGLGKSKRIVFFDTLLARLSHQEIEAVLAHELGHFAHKHVLKRIGVTLLLSLGFFALLGWLATQPWFYAGLGVEPRLAGGNEATALLLFVMVVPVFSFFFAPLASLVSRRHEFEADAFAARQTEALALVSALVKLYDDNASTLTPDPLHSAFYDSHPPAAIRIQRLLAA